MTDDREAERQRWANLDAMYDAWRAECVQRRYAAGASVAALARAAHVSRTTVHRIEDGASYWPTSYTVAAVSYALGFTLNELADVFAADPDLLTILAMDGGTGLTGYEFIAVTVMGASRL